MEESECFSSCGTAAAAGAACMGDEQGDWSSKRHTARLSRGTIGGRGEGRCVAMKTGRRSFGQGGGVGTRIRVYSLELMGHQANLMNSETWLARQAPFRGLRLGKEAFVTPSSPRVRETWTQCLLLRNTVLAQDAAHLRHVRRAPLAIKPPTWLCGSEFLHLDRIAHATVATTISNSAARDPPRQRSQ